LDLSLSRVKLRENLEESLRLLRPITLTIVQRHSIALSLLSTASGLHNSRHSSNSGMKNELQADVFVEHSTFALEYLMVQIVPPWRVSAPCDTSILPVQ
jgi:hypothetical protein